MHGGRKVSRYIGTRQGMVGKGRKEGRVGEQGKKGTSRRSRKAGMGRRVRRKWKAAEEQATEGNVNRMTTNGRRATA